MKYLNSKPRSDARLKTLAPERQNEIAAFARNHTLAQTVAWLAEAGLTTSLSAVSQFLRWLKPRQDLVRSQAALQDKLVEMVRQDPSPSAERLHQLGLTQFVISAMENVDTHAWCVAQRLALDKARLEFEVQKLASSKPTSPLFIIGDDVTSPGLPIENQNPQSKNVINPD